MKTAIRDLQTLFDAGTLGALSNGDLLDRFLAHRREADFTLLVERLGPMVWAVCRRVLRHHHDAEDAFQATFLVLARKADSIRPRDKVGPWLYGVAYQTARKARAKRLKQQTREPSFANPIEPAAVPPSSDDRLIQLDQEIHRLPPKYRIPLILCELQGHTHQQAAAQLGWPIGTVSGRLSRAKTLLANRLTKRGVSLSSASLLAHLDPASAGMPIHLITSTVRAASLSVGRILSAATVSASVSALTSEVLNAMFLTKLKFAGAVLLAVSLSGLGVVGVGVVMSAFGPSAIGQEPAQSKPSDRAKELARLDEEQLQGTWIITDIKQVSSQPTDEEKAFMKSGAFTITIQGKNLIYDSDKRSLNFHLDPTRSPKRMTLVAPGRGENAPAIYKLDGDDLMIFQGQQGDREPPSGFTLEDRQPGTFPILLVLKRKDGARKAGPDSENPAPSDPKIHALIKARVETARDIFEQESLRYTNRARLGQGLDLLSIDTADWSLHWMEDELRLSTTPAEKLAAVQHHIDRMRWLERIAVSYAKSGQDRMANALKMKYYRLDAEQKLAELHAAHPDVPLPKPKELGKKPQAIPESPPPPN